MRCFCCALLLLLVLTGVRAETPAPKTSEADRVSYYKEVRPILQQNCQGCHQPAKAGGGFVMTSFADLFKTTDHEEPGIVAHKPAASAVYKQITPEGTK